MLCRDLTNRQPGAPWRVEWHECGFAARYWVVRGWREIGPCDVDGDFTNESDALARADELNGPVQGITK
jgi:hypothetical protein